MHLDVATRCVRVCSRRCFCVANPANSKVRRDFPSQKIERKNSLFSSFLFCSTSNPVQPFVDPAPKDVRIRKKPDIERVHPPPVARRMPF
ncbi:hypothetical protein F2P81_001266 [Scophthalmus maximus]|uniref:Uncharacterized protein n=1 Tax=Scophthalmus maximus TaxID=52904 RepID=A0A6A4TN81_SCOMX|nr:hypothetical protein F2P81_001266 [Scophthalmus maximus]